jgi:hypothetical protein
MIACLNLQFPNSEGFEPKSTFALSYQYLAYKLFSRHCDICKDFRLEIPAIHSSDNHNIIW